MSSRLWYELLQNKTIYKTHCNRRTDGKVFPHHFCHLSFLLLVSGKKMNNDYIKISCNEKRPGVKDAIIC